MSSVNENIKKIMFGAQKQANRVNDAAVRFVERCMLEHGALIPGEDVDYDTMVVKLSSVIQASARSLFGEDDAGLSNETLVNLLVDHKTLCNASSSCTVSSHIISDTGKVLFILRGAGEQYNATQYESSIVERESKTANQDNDAMALVERILAHCPNRSDYPDDDVLAAIMYGKIYWKEVQD